MHDEITVIISTSASRLPVGKQETHMRRVLDSLAQCAPLSGSRKLIVFDALPCADFVAKRRPGRFVREVEEDE